MLLAAAAVSRRHRIVEIGSCCYTAKRSDILPFRSRRLNNTIERRMASFDVRSSNYVTTASGRMQRLDKHSSTTFFRIFPKRCERERGARDETTSILNARERHRLVGTTTTAANDNRSGPVRPGFGPSPNRGLSWSVRTLTWTDIVGSTTDVDDIVPSRA